MVSDSFLPQSRLNLLSLPNHQQEKLVNSGVALEAEIYFEYGRMEQSYQTGENLLDQIINKAIPIAESLYLGWGLLFMLDNTTSHSIYVKDALQVAQMNKGTGGQQLFLRAGW